MELIIVDEVDSTNDEARRLITAGREPGFAVAAKRQTAGRGRLQRVWQTPAGNLSLTITVPWKIGRVDGSTVALVTGLAVQRTVSAMTERADVAIKWPNDVLIDGAKVSGTLIEADGAVLCIGIGINVVSKPDGLAYPTTCLRAVGSFVEMPALARSVVANWLPLYATWQAHGFRALRQAYNDRLHLVGQTARISLDREKRNWTTGICHGVDESGRLILEGDGGSRAAYTAGDVEAATP